MGKADFLSPKAIANRIKSKGLQKLKWYCQMCEKQCRDDNGFKCHLTSEAHQRQMMLFSENSSRYLSQHNREFEHTFLLSRRYNTKRVLANTVYQEYISDKQHLHMNATTFGSLTSFCYHLGKKGVVEVDNTDKGLYITWIDRSPGTLSRQDAAQRKERMEKTDEEIDRKLLDAQIEKAKKLFENEQPEEVTEAPKELVREEGQKISLKTTFMKPIGFSKKMENKPNVLKMAAKTAASTSQEPVKESHAQAKASVMDSIIESEEARKKRKLESQSQDGFKKQKH